MKKYLIIFLCLLSGGLVYWLWPEYGSGYSEEQRRLWNERRALYPAVWLASTSTPDKDLPTFVDWMEGGQGTSTCWLVSYENICEPVKEKEAREEELKKKIFENRSRSGEVYQGKPFLREEISRLPLEGLGEKETAELALAGNGDACLQMVRYLCRKAVWGVYDLSWRDRKEINKWLDRAMVLKRPGALFLKCFFQQECKAEMVLTERARMAEDEWNERARQRLGYDEYLECVKKGDYRLYATVAGLCSYSAPPEEYRLIHDVLLQEAEKGRAEAQRNLAALCFDSFLYKFDFFLFCEICADEKRQRAAWESHMTALDYDWKSRIISALSYCRIISADKAPALRTFREAASYAREAALQGDMTGKYLWMRYGLKSIRKFSAREWEDIFAYDRQLIESGYAPYLAGMESETLDSAVMQSFYSEESWGMRRNKNERVSLAACQLKDVLRWDDAGETRRRLEVLELTGRTDYLLNELIGGGSRTVLFAASAEVQACLLEKVRKWGEEGDLRAVCALADFYKKGIGHPVDPGRANFMYGLVLSKDKAANGIFVPVWEWDDVLFEANWLSLKHLALLGRAGLVLDYPEFPGRDESGAYDLLLEFADSSESREYCPYLLGRFHELGKGRPADGVKAMEFYKKEKVRNREYRKAMERLTGSANGE